MFQSKVFFSKEDMHYRLNTVHRQYIRRVSDSGLVVLMSGHFASQCCCHLTSLLFYKKGHSMHSDTKTHICTLPYSLQLHTFLDVNMHTVNPHYAQSTCNPTKCIPHWFQSQNAHPAAIYHTLPRMQQASPEISDTMQYVLHRLLSSW